MNIDWGYFANSKKAGKKRAVQIDTISDGGHKKDTVTYWPVADGQIADLFSWFENAVSVPLEKVGPRHFAQIEDCPKCGRPSLDEWEWRFPQLDMCVDCDPRDDDGEVA